MESRIQRFLLTTGALLALTNSVWAQDDANDDQAVLEAIISPDIQRRQVDEDKIDSENFGFGIYSGVMSIEDFGTNNVYGVRLSYLISEDWFLEAAAGTTKTSKTSFEELTGTELQRESDRELTYYNLSLGLNVFPGEIFLGKRYAFNTSYFLAAGVGNTDFAADEYFTLNFGGGFQAVATDFISFRIGFRNHLMTHNIFGEDKSIQNLEAVVGLSLFL